MKGIDVKDRRLLYHLSRDARSSHTHLARQVGLSKSAVSYRIGRLRREGVVTRFASVIHLGALGLETFAVLLKFRDDVSGDADVMGHFASHPFSDWVITLSGGWDIFAEFVCEGVQHLHAILKEIISRFGERISAYRVFFSFDTVKVEHLVPEVYADLGMERKAQEPRTQGRVEVDATDRRLLRALSEDSSRSYLALAKELGVSVDVIGYRMGKLANAGVLASCFAEVSLSRLGYGEHLCLLSLHNASEGEIARLQGFLRDDPNVTYAFLDTLSLNVVFVCAHQNLRGVDSMSRALRQAFPDTLGEQEYLIVRDHVKFDLFPQGLVPPH